MTQSILKAIPLFFTLTVLLSSPWLTVQASNKIVAVVNDEIVTQNQLNQILHGLKQQNQFQGVSMGPAQLKKLAIKQLIDNKLLLQIAKQNNISTTDEEVNQHIHNIAKQNHLSLDQFKNVLQKEGSNFKAYQEFVKNQITLSKLRSQFLMPKIKVTQKDVLTELAHAKKIDVQAPVNIIDIVITPATDEDKKAALSASEKIRQKLMQGGELQTTLKNFKNSKVKVTSQSLGWKMLPELPDLFANAVKNLPAGQITQPIEAPNGIHLLAIAARKGGNVSHQDAERMAAHKKIEIELEKWLVEIRKSAYIDIK